MLNMVDAVREGQGHVGSTPTTSTISDNNLRSFQGALGAFLPVPHLDRACCCARLQSVARKSHAALDSREYPKKSGIRICEVLIRMQGMRSAHRIS